MFKIGVIVDHSTTCTAHKHTSYAAPCFKTTCKEGMMGRLLCNFVSKGLNLVRGGGALWYTTCKFKYSSKKIDTIPIPSTLIYLCVQICLDTLFSFFRLRSCCSDPSRDVPAPPFYDTKNDSRLR